jgi:hypothetical protein
MQLAFAKAIQIVRLDDFWKFLLVRNFLDAWWIHWASHSTPPPCTALPPRSVKHLLTKCSLNDFARSVLVELEGVNRVDETVSAAAIIIVNSRIAFIPFGS